MLDEAQLNVHRGSELTILPVLQAGEVLQPRLVEGSKGLASDGSHLGLDEVFNPKRIEAVDTERSNP